MKERPIESMIPSEIMEKAREYAKTIEHSYADTREELEEDVAKAWAKGFTFCLQGKVTAIYKDKEDEIQKLTDENKKLQTDVEYYTQKLEKVLSDLSKMKCLEEEIIKALKKCPYYEWSPAHNGEAKHIYLQSAIAIVHDKFEEVKEKCWIRL